MDDFDDAPKRAKPARKRRRGDRPSPDDAADRGDGRTRVGTFANGVSGNRKGRPKGSESASTIARRVLASTVILPTKDGPERVSRTEAAIRQLSSLGLVKQNVRALIASIDMAFRLEAKDEQQAPMVPLSPADQLVLELIRDRLAAEPIQAEQIATPDTSPTDNTEDSEGGNGE